MALDPAVWDKVDAINTTNTNALVAQATERSAADEASVALTGNPAAISLSGGLPMQDAAGAGLYQSKTPDPNLAPVAERGFLGDLGSGLARGGVNLLDTTAHAVDVLTPGGSETARSASDYLEGLPARTPLLRPDMSEAAGTEGAIKKGAMSAAQSMPESLAILPAAATGAAIGTAVLPGVGTAIGGAIGGGAALLGLFGAGQYGKKKDEVVKTLTETRPDLKPEQIEDMAHKNALTTGYSEVLGEGAGDLAAYLIFRSIPGGAALYKGGKTILKELANPNVVKTIGKGLIKDAPFEAASEVGTSYFQNEADKAIGVNQGTTKQAMLDSIIPALFLSTGMGTALGGYNAYQRKQAYDSLNVGTTEERLQAAQSVARSLQEATDEKVAGKWMGMAEQLITSDQQIPLDFNIADLAADRPDGGKSPALMRNLAVAELRQANLPTRDLIALKNGETLDPSIPFTAASLASRGITPEHIDGLLNDRADELGSARQRLADIQASGKGGPLTKVSQLVVADDSNVMDAEHIRRQTQRVTDAGRADAAFQGYDPAAPESSMSPAATGVQALATPGGPVTKILDPATEVDWGIQERKSLAERRAANSTGIANDQTVDAAPESPAAERGPGPSLPKFSELNNFEDRAALVPPTDPVTVAPGQTPPVTAETSALARQRQFTPEQSKAEIAYDLRQATDEQDAAAAQEEWQKQTTAALKHNETANNTGKLSGRRAAARQQEAQAAAQAVIEKEAARREAIDAVNKKDPLYAQKQALKESIAAQGTVPETGGNIDETEAQKFERHVEFARQTAREKRIQATAEKENAKHDAVIKSAPPEVVATAKKAAAEMTKDGVYAEMAEAKRRGINLATSRQAFSKDTVAQIHAKHEKGIFTKKGEIGIDEYAQEKGYTSANEMLNSWNAVDSKKAVEARTVQEHLDSWENSEAASKEAPVVDTLVDNSFNPEDFAEDKIVFAKDEQVAALAEQVENDPRSFNAQSFDGPEYTDRQRKHLKAAYERSYVAPKRGGAEPLSEYRLRVATDRKAYLGITEKTTKETTNVADQQQNQEVEADKSLTKAQRQATRKAFAGLSPVQRNAAESVIRNGKIKVLTQAEAEAMTGVNEDGTQGFVENGITYLIPENMKEGNLWGLLRHEIGTHVGKLIREKGDFKTLLKNIHARQQEKGRTGDAIRAAYVRVNQDENNDNKSDDARAEEALAYLVEDAQDIGLVRRFIQTVKDALRSLGINPGNFTVEDLTALADAAIYQEAGFGEAQNGWAAKNTREGGAIIDPLGPGVQRSIHTDKARQASLTRYFKKMEVAPDIIEKHFVSEKEFQILKDLLEKNADRLPRQTLVDGGPVRGNSDNLYLWSFDLASMCVKRLGYGANLSELAKRLGRAPNIDQSIMLTIQMVEDGHDAPCLYCYVESPRRIFLQEINRYAAIMSGQTELLSPDAPSYADDVAMAKKAQAQGFELEEFDYRYLIDPEYAQKDVSAHQKRFPEIYQHINNRSASVSTQNKVKTYQEYTAQMISKANSASSKTHGQPLRDYLNARAGFRIFSTSDFQIEHAMDLMQLVQDLHITGMIAHAYTKVEEFVKTFGKTGLKIQCSVFGVEHTNPDGTFEIVPNTSMGMDWNSAKKFRKIEGGNVGTVFVSTSDNMTHWALAQPWIDYIIPFHSSGMPKEYYTEDLAWTNYTGSQNEKLAKADKAGKYGVGDRKILMADILNAGAGTDRRGMTDKEATDRYLALLKERGTIGVFPKFQFVHEHVKKEGKLIWEPTQKVHPGYIKLKKDYSRTDTDFVVPDPTKIDVAGLMRLTKEWLKRGGGKVVEAETATIDKVMERIAKGETGSTMLQGSSLRNVQRSRLALAKGATPSISGTAEGLEYLINPLGDNLISARIGEEKITYEDISLVKTAGKKFKTGSGVIQSGRYILKSRDGKYIGAAQYTKIGSNTTLSNIYVSPKNRRTGAASRLVGELKKDFKNIKSDSNFSEDGASFMGVQRSKVKQFRSYGAEVKGDKVVLYRGGNVSEAKLKKLSYNEYLSASAGNEDATGNDGAAKYGKNVVRLELPLDEVEVTGAGEFLYKGGRIKGAKYPEAIYKAFSDAQGYKFTPAEVDANDEKYVRAVASQAFSDGRDEFDRLMAKHQGAKRSVLKPNLSLGEKKERKGYGISYPVKDGSKKIGNIAGSDNYAGSYGDINKQLGFTGQYFDLRATEMREGFRGTGKYQEFIQAIAKDFENGVVVKKFQASPALQKALRKIPGVMETEDFFHVTGVQRAKFKAVDTTSPEFKKWFGDWTDPNAFSSRRRGAPVSVAVDENGKPLRLFHATREQFDAFEVGRETVNSTTFGDAKTRRFGIFMTADPAFAGEYVGQEKGGAVMPLYLNVKSPLDLTKGITEQIEQDLEAAGINIRWMNNIQNTWELFDEDRTFVDAAKKAGYDGAIIDEEGIEVWVAFEPHQVKSAISNTGEFSEDASIQRSKFKAVDTTSPEFKSWFGSSKVVDENGAPLRVYHGSSQDINEFSRDKIKMGVGFFFTAKKETARGYADRYVGKGKGQIAQAYLKLENPLDLTTREGKKENEAIRSALGERYSREAYVNEARARGYDGRILLGKIVNGGEIEVFSPTQIKSALTNTGEFSETNPDIRRSQFKPVNPNDPKLQAWLGKSKIREQVYHGTTEKFEAFDKQLRGKNAQSPGAGLGHFFAQDRNESLAYGDVQAFFVRLENPKEMKASALPKFRNAEEAQAYTKRMKLAGHDGLILTDEGHVIVFDDNQVKSAELNTGEFSLTDVRFNRSKAKEGVAVLLSAKTPQIKQRRMLSQIKHAASGSFKYDSGPIEELFQAANLVRSIGDEAQENIVVVMTDGQDLPVAVLRHSVGKVASGTVEVPFLLGAAHSIPAVKNIWIAHNHPSGNPNLSKEDLNIARIFSDLSQGTGVKFRGIVAVTLEGDFSGSTDGFSTDEGYTSKPRFSGSVKGLVRKVAKQSAEQPITGAEDAEEWLKKNAKGQSGLLLLNTPNRPTGFLPMSIEEMNELRTGDKGSGASKVLAAFESTNSTGAIIAAPTHQVANMIQFLDAHSIRAIDTVINGVSGNVSGINNVLGTERGKTGPKVFRSKAFFSKLQQVSDDKFTGMKAQSVEPFLLKQGVKKAEIEATGLREWLASKNDAPFDPLKIIKTGNLPPNLVKITKQDLLDFVKANTVEFEDVVLGGGQGFDLYESDEPDGGKWISAQEFNNGQFDSIRLANGTSVEIDEWFGDEDVEIYSKPVYSDNELSVYIASSDGRRFWATSDNAESTIREDAPSVLAELLSDQYGENVEVKTDTHFDHYTEPGARAGSYREMFVTAPPVKDVRPANKISKDKIFDLWDRGEITRAERDARLESEIKPVQEWQDGHSQYSTVKNPLVRIRFNEVEGPNGERILRIEEMQGPSADNQAKMPRYLRDNIYQTGVKRILAYAKENGFDGVALATKPGMSAGETQADRYSLEKQISLVRAFANGDGTYNIFAYNEDVQVVEKKNVPESELPGLVGKDLAKKISEQPYKRGEYAGLDLKVGGEGLKQLYDTDLPNIFKAWGGLKMGEISVDTGRQSSNKEINPLLASTSGDIDGSKTAMPYIPITAKTPSSFPMRSKYKPVDTTSENFKKWFKDSKVVDEDGDPLRVYHGTTFQFFAFDNEKARAENNLGSAFYFSDERGDSDHNYAGMGPDLTNRYQSRVERLQQEIADDPEAFGLRGNPTDAAIEKKAEVLAKKELVGKKPQVMELYLSLQNPAVLGGDNPTYLSYDMEIDEDELNDFKEQAWDEIKDDEDLTDEDREDYEDQIEERAREMFDENKYDAEPSGPIQDVLDSIESQLSRLDEGDFDQVREDVQSVVYFGDSIKAEKLIDILKKSEGLAYVTDYDNGDGELMSSEVIRKAFEAAGFDGFIDHTVSRKFNMDGVGQTHYLAFQPNQVKSAVSNTGEFDPSNPDIRRSKAFHGSPHNVDKFRSEKIGTGEGAQAYGYGLYFAESEDVAKWYKDSLGTSLVYVDGKRVGTFSSLSSAWPLNAAKALYKDRSAQQAAETVLQAFRMANSAWDAAKKEIEGLNDYFKERALSVFEEVKSRVEVKRKGSMYEVELAPQEDEYLLWDKPLIEQSEKVKSALEKKFSLPSFIKDYPMARDFYKNRTKRFQSQEKASAELHALGIKGIKYLDGSSRGKGDGNFNYVIFNEDDVKIERKYSKLSRHNAETKEALRNVGAIPEPVTFKAWWTETRKDLKLKIQHYMVDQYAPLKKLGEDVYLQARMAAGQGGALEAMMHFGDLILRDGVTDVKVGETRGVIEAFQDLQGEQHDFLWWIAANRAEKLTAEERENLFKEKDIAVLLKLNQGKMADGQDRTKVYEAVLKDYVRANKNVMDIAEQSELIDGATRADWEHDMYVPFYRAKEEGVVEGPRGGGSGGLVRQYAFKQLKGGTRKLHNDLLANVLMNWSHILDASAKNRAASKALQVAEEMEVAEYIGESPKGKGNVFYMGRFDEVVKIDGEDTAVSVWGKKYYSVSDPLVLESLNALEFSGFKGTAMDALTKTKRMLTMGVTANPAFKIRNLMRDAMTTPALSGASYNAVGNVGQGFRAMRAKGQTYASLLAGGGIIRFGSMLEDNSAAHVDKLINAGVKQGDILDTKEKLSGFFSGLWDRYNDLGDISEGANRAALYEQLRAKGASHAEASYQARDLMDFHLRGAGPAARFLAQTVPFFNARAQGLYKLARAGKADPKRLGAVLGATAMASIALMLAYKDDDDWKEREDWDRDTYFWFKVGNRTLRIPKGFEVGAIATLAERGLEVFVSDEMTAGRFGKRVLAMLGQTLSFNPTPQLIKPLVDLYADKDSFTGRPIEGPTLEGRLKSDRKTNRTSEIAKALGAAGDTTGISPVQIDHLIRGYFGWLGTAMTTVTDIAARPVLGRPAMADMRLRDMFLAGNFVETLPRGSSRYVTEFYEQSKELQQAWASIRADVKQGEARPANAGVVRQQAKQAARAQKLMSVMTERIRAVENNREMTGAEKRTQIDLLTARRNQLAKNALR